MNFVREVVLGWRHVHRRCNLLFAPSLSRSLPIIYRESDRYSCENSVCEVLFPYFGAVTDPSTPSAYNVVSSKGVSTVGLLGVRSAQCGRKLVVSSRYLGQDRGV